MKTFITLVCLCLICTSCSKKSEPKPSNQTLQIIVTGARIDYSYNLSCSDITNWSSPSVPEPTPFWSVSGLTTDSTFTVNVYPGEKIDLEDVFHGNYSNLPGTGTIATVKINGTTLATSLRQESSGGHIFTVPAQ